MTNRLTWRTARRQKAQGVQADDKKRRTLELEFERWSLLERTAALAELAYMQAVDSNAHLVGSASNKRLAKKYSRAACQITGRAVEVQIRTPSSKDSSGQFTRTRDRGYIQLDPNLDARSAVTTFLHETAHAVRHWDGVAISKLHLKSPRSINNPVKPPKNQAKYDRHENEANELADKMVALLELYVDPLKPGYEHRALDWLILDSS